MVDQSAQRFGSALRTSTFRLALAYCALFTVGVGLLLGTIYLLTESVLSNEVDHLVNIEVDALADEYDREGLEGVTAELARLNETWGRARAIYLLVDRQLNRQAGNIPSWPFESVPSGPWHEFTVKALSGTEDHPVRARILTLPEGYLLVGTEVSQRMVFQSRFRAAMLWGIGGTALLGALMGLWLSRRLLARVGSVSMECERILAGDLSRRLPVTGARDEFDSLALAMNRVLERLDEQTGVLRATFDSAAHDLRGPLFRLRGRIEELQRGATLDEPARTGLDRALRDIDSLQRTLAILLQIAHAESGAPLADSAPVALGALAAEICALYEPAALEKGFQLSCITEDVRVNGNRQLLTQLLANLLENVLKHAGPAGAVEVKVRRTPEGPRLEVADHGRGIAQADRDRALRPFVQLSSNDTSGSGLGLSLVAAIARLHRAQLSLEDNAPGLRVIVQFGAANAV
jgi:signal transduction histidine kinase